MFSILPIWLQILGAFIMGFWLGTTLMYHCAMKRIKNEKEKDIKEFIEWELIKKGTKNV